LFNNNFTIDAVAEFAAAALSNGAFVCVISSVLQGWRTYTCLLRSPRLHVLSSPSAYMPGCAGGEEDLIAGSNLNALRLAGLRSSTGSGAAAGASSNSNGSSGSTGATEGLKSSSAGGA
jgi:hypothetical protein